MDKKGSESGKGGNWAWLPAVMPGVARLMAEKRQALGHAHVNECWKRGVVNLEPGWFFAREGAVWVGVPPTEPDFATFVAQQFTATQSVLYLRLPEVADGTH